MEYIISRLKEIKKEDEKRKKEIINLAVKIIDKVEAKMNKNITDRFELPFFEIRCSLQERMREGWKTLKVRKDDVFFRGDRQITIVHENESDGFPFVQFKEVVNDTQLRQEEIVDENSTSYTLIAVMSKFLEEIEEWKPIFLKRS